MNLVPTNLNNFIYNKKIATRLNIYDKNYLENLVFYGQNNSGKRTLIGGLLSKLADNNVIKRNMKTYKLKINNNKIDINFIESKYHFEINLYEYGHYDKAIICEFFKYVLSYKNISELSYKVIILHHFDKVSKIAQLALRMIIEKSYKIGRFIICCENINQIDKALLSRFICVRVPKPNNETIKDYVSLKLKEVNKKNESITDHILSISNGCMYKTNLLLENYINMGYIDKSLIINEVDIIKPILREIEEKDLKSISVIKKIVYKYLLLNISPKTLFLSISSYYNTSDKFMPETIHKLINLTAEIDNIIDKVSYDIFALEYYILNLKYILLTI
tara:strand:- start:979 stop:1977 length:999 start_codon:yes stop_codon:yes gene_type:complete